MIRWVNATSALGIHTLCVGPSIITKCLPTAGICTCNPYAPVTIGPSRSVTAGYLFARNKRHHISGIEQMQIDIDTYAFLTTRNCQFPHLSTLGVVAPGALTEARRAALSAGLIL